MKVIVMFFFYFLFFLCFVFPFFELQAHEEMHVLNMHLPISKYMLVWHEFPKNLKNSTKLAQTIKSCRFYVNTLL